MSSMPPQLLDGNALAALWKQKIKDACASFDQKPCLAAVLVGNDGASQSYVQFKIKDCEEVGFKSKLIQFSVDTSQASLLQTIEALNQDASVHGYIVQLPLPSHIDEQTIIAAIDPQKDVDGFHPLHAGRLMLGQPGFVPATPWGILAMLEHYQIATEGAEIAVIGRSHIVGRPLSVLLSSSAKFGNGTVTLLHSKSKHLKEHCLRADILVAALGKPGFVTADMVKPGAVVIDVGTTRVADSSSARGWRLKGDVDFDNVAPKTKAISPVPGGVGPMTRIGLLYNTLEAYTSLAL
jgi:methylenetetrahydrofolate dehydrogenase (NADP+) / methenyltetrahydrofolate cyclohydrolase